MTTSEPDRTWIVHVEVGDWRDRKCTDAFEALGIKVAAKGCLTSRRIGRPLPERAGSSWSQTRGTRMTPPNA